MTKHISTLLAAVVGLLATSASWANYECTGTIDFVSLSPDGLVTVGSQSSGLAVFYPCQIGTTVNGVGPDACKAILAELMMAHATGAQVTWAFNDSLTCNRSTYNGGNWYWLGASPSSWYYGPQVQ